MKFPEGRLYTVQFTGEEIVWLLDQDFLWKDYERDSVADTAQMKVHTANELRQQDNAVAHLYESTRQRHDWLERVLRQKYKEEYKEVRETDTESLSP